MGDTSSYQTAAQSANGLEPRVRRLEDALAELQDTRALEDRVVGRVVERVRAMPAAPAAIVVEAHPPVAVSPLLLPPPVRGVGWLADLLRELRLMVRMLLDPRYRMSWTARWVVLAAIGLAVFSWFFVGAIWFVGPWVDKLFDFLLAFVVYKVFSREAACYQQMAETYRGR